MVTEKELNEAITELGAAATKLGDIITELNNPELTNAFREHALRGFYNFTTECTLIDCIVELEVKPD